MADLIVGYPSNLTVVSAGAGGNIRVTYQPWELDWEFFDLVAVDGTHFLANTTTVVSVAIIAKGGSENLGYWFEINQAFPSANWNTGDRITPQRQAAINQFATFLAAVAAMVFDDALLVWYSAVTNNRFWYEPCIMTNKSGGVWGMLSRQQLLIHGGDSPGIQISGNLLGQTVQLQAVNLRLRGHAGSSFGLYFAPGAGQEGAGILAKRLRTMATQGVYLARANAGTAFAINCIAVGGNTGFYINLGAGPIYNCGAAGARLNGFQATGCLNCWAADCGNGFTGVSTFCADTDGSLPVDPSNLRNQDMRNDLRFFYDLARPGNKAFPANFRICGDSVLVGAGTPLAAVPRDADGRIRPATPSIGPWEPYASAFVPGSELIRPALRLPGVGA